MISPTGKPIVRMDTAGSGRYGSKRNGRIHGGTDFLVEKNAPVYAPTGGYVLREATPYAGEKYRGLVIIGREVSVKMFYLSPLPDIVGATVSEGEVVGYAQDVSELHGEGMHPHIHMEIISCSPELLIEGLEYEER